MLEYLIGLIDGGGTLLSATDVTLSIAEGLGGSARDVEESAKALDRGAKDMRLVTAPAAPVFKAAGEVPVEPLKGLAAVGGTIGLIDGVLADVVQTGARDSAKVAAVLVVILAPLRPLLPRRRGKNQQLGRSLGQAGSVTAQITRKYHSKAPRAVRGEIKRLNAGGQELLDALAAASAEFRVLGARLTPFAPLADMARDFAAMNQAFEPAARGFQGAAGIVDKLLEPMRIAADSWQRRDKAALDAIKQVLAQNHIDGKLIDRLADPLRPVRTTLTDEIAAPIARIQRQIQDAIKPLQGELSAVVQALLAAEAGLGRLADPLGPALDAYIAAAGKHLRIHPEA